MTPDVAIIGAGIVGCACAASLAQNGLRVALIESDTVGSGASAAGMGHLVVMDDNAAELALSAYSLRLWRKQVQGRGEAHEFSPCGTLWIAADEEEMAAAYHKCETLKQHGVGCELLGARALARLEPQVRSGMAGGLFVSDDAVVYAPKSAQLLLKQAQQHGARLIVGRAQELDEHGLLLADGSHIKAKNVVVANGIHASALLPELPLRPKKGHLLITDRYPGLVRHQLVELGYVKSAHATAGESVAFNLQPRPTGQLLIGSSRQFDTLDPAVEPPILQRMLEHALHFVPALAALNAIRSWTGFRAASPDGLPLIGPHPSRPNVWLATGHEGLGVTTSLATARLLAAQMLGAAPEIPCEAYLPARFPALVAYA